MSVSGECVKFLIVLTIVNPQIHDWVLRRGGILVVAVRKISLAIKPWIFGDLSRIKSPIAFFLWLISMPWGFDDQKTSAHYFEILNTGFSDEGNSTLASGKSWEEGALLSRANKRIFLKKVCVVALPANRSNWLKINLFHLFQGQILSALKKLVLIFVSGNCFESDRANKKQVNKFCSSA